MADNDVAPGRFDKRNERPPATWRGEQCPEGGKTKTAESVEAAASRGGKGARSQNVALARRTGRPLPATLDVISPTRAYTCILHRTLSKRFERS